MTYHDVIRDRDQHTDVGVFDSNTFYILRKGLYEYWYQGNNQPLCRLLMTSLSPIN